MRRAIKRLFKGGTLIMKGIILGGGLGTRLYPITKAINKHLLNLYDKPVIYYPLSTLMSLGINEILLITQKNNIPFYKKILGNGNDFGIKLNYAIQNKPGGLTEAFTIGAKFIDKDSVALILGDNIFISETFTQYLSDKIRNFKSGGIILANKVADPKPFGVVTFDKNFNVINVEEKPTKPKSNYIIPGLYFFDNNVVSIAKKITPSHRGEKEITSVINKYLENKTLKTIIMPKDTL
jgi:glucose-1-phosphate thymidylyltransferase